MRRWQSILVLLVIGLLFAGCAKIGPDEGGVRTNYLVAKGIRPASLGPGLYLHIPSISEVKAYNIREHRYEMTKDPASGDTSGRDDVMLKTKDGQNCSVDTTIRYRLLRDKLPVLHEMYGDNYVKDAIRPMSRALAAYKFGELSAEQIYDGANREELGRSIRCMLNEGYDDQDGLKGKGIEVLDVLFRRFEFAEEYQSAIEQKRLAAEQRLAAVENAKRVEAEAEGEKLAMIKRAEGQAESVRRKAAADLESEKMRAEGIKAVGLAEAESKDAMARALGGGEQLVMMEFARNLAQSLQIWGIPVGQQSTSLMDLSGLFKGMLTPSQSTVPAPVAK